MHAREGVVSSDAVRRTSCKRLFPVVEPDCCDSGTFDNVLEFLLMTGRTLQEAVMMMVPEAWQKHETMSEPSAHFYEYHSSLMEPWDGPASIAFTDGKYIGAVLDRNGLRPSRYYITHDDRVIMASEVGVLPVGPANGQGQGPLASRADVPDRLRARPADPRRRAEERLLHCAGRTATGSRTNRIESGRPAPRAETARLRCRNAAARMQAFGYTVETMKFMLLPMVADRSADPVGSMGNDSALACLSDKPRMIYDYFKQLFAQVTNPAIDSIREEVIMSLECYIGPEQTCSRSRPSSRIACAIPHPILTNEATGRAQAHRTRRLAQRQVDRHHLSARRRPSGLPERSTASVPEAEQAIDDGYTICHPVRSRIDVDRVPDQFAAGVRRRSPSPGHASQTHPDRHRGGNRRSARSAPSLPADRLRCRCDQSVPGV